MSSYYSDKVTDEKLKKIEKRIAKMYRGAYAEMKDTAILYFDKFADRYAKEYEAFLKGKYTENEFKLWVKTQIARGKSYEDFRDSLAKRMTEANKVASVYINDATPTIFNLNRDYEAKIIDDAYGIDFHLTDETTVRRMVNRNNHIEFRTTSINPQRDYVWNRKQIHNALSSAIMQGKSIDKLADSFYVVMQRNRASAIRNARTAFTSAQNAGRLETYYRANEMGISLQKEWIATSDDRTRESHAFLDGQRVAYDEEFSNGLMYPADPQGEPAEVYNCRCTMRAILPNINDRKRLEKW